MKTPSRRRPRSSRRASGELELFEARFGQLLHAMPDAVVLSNAAGRVVLANRQAELLFGYAPGQMVGRFIESLMPERYRNPHLAHRHDYLGQPRVRPMGAGLELYGLRKDQSEFPAEISLSPLVTDHGPVVVSAIRDITQRKRFERELQEKNAALKSANEELEAYSYSISHDLRAPLRAMTGYAGILQDKFGPQLPEEARQALSRIQASGAKMGRLIDALLDFASLTWMELRRREVQPSGIARAVFEELRTDFKDRRVKFEVAKVPACRADPLLLRQVFTNLLSNAVKYTRGRDPALIRVGCQTDQKDPTYFVQDNGAGFDMRYADKLFGVFQRLHREDQFEGTGVGLAIAHRIIRRHGGNIWAEAQVDQGATFYFTLSGAK